VWDGAAAIDGKTILVSAEQGLGDTLQFLPLCAMLAARARVVLDVPPSLRRLLSTLAGVAGFVTRNRRAVRYLDPDDEFAAGLQYHAGEHPRRGSVLKRRSERSAAWRHWLTSLPGRKIGLVGLGRRSAGNRGRRRWTGGRSMALADFAPLAELPGLSLISLQKGDAAAQARTPPAGMPLHDRTDELDDYADTAALIEALDLVISVDTSVCICGALGKPVWVLNRNDQCWRWLRGSLIARGIRLLGCSGRRRREIGRA